MTRRLILLMLLVCTAGAVQLWAHDEFRIIGTLERHQESTIAVKKNTGTVVSIRIDRQTSITQNDKKVDSTALKAGQTLVVDAYGDTEDDSLTLEIRIVPSIQPKAR